MAEAGQGRIRVAAASCLHGPVARRAAPNSVAELDCRRTAHTACSSCRTRWTARSAQALVVPGVDGALLLAYTGSVQEKMRPLRVLLLGACVYLALLGPVGAKKKSKRAARLAAKKAAADSFHGSAGAAPWQMEASYMPEDFSGVKVAKDMAIREMFDRIVAGWPGASYVSSSGGGVIKIENFVTEEEAEHLIKIGDEAGLEGSSGTGVKQADGTFKREHSDYRTSKNSWLMGKFMTDPVVTTVDARIANLTGLYAGNSEHYQVLRYSGAGDEYYKVHSDFIPGHLELPSGPRLFTMFIYLTDVPQGHGGHTFFPLQAPTTENGKACRSSYLPWEEIRDVDEYKCGLLVRPQRGHAVLWPNADLDDLSRQNPFTEHMALPIHGCDECVKWAANVWIHLYDFKAAHVKGLGG